MENDNKDPQDVWWNSHNRNNPEQIPNSYTPSPNNEDQISPYYEKVDQNKPQAPTDNTVIRWTAKEFIYQDKEKSWFVSLFCIVIAFILFDFLLMKSYTFSVLIIVMAVSLIIYSRRPARDINYTLSLDKGLYIGERLYSFQEFKSFSLVKEGSHNLIYLTPFKRFSLGVSVYFPQEVGENLVDIFGARLPMSERKLDFIDIVARKLRL